MATVLLPSKEIVDTESVIESLIDVGWGVKGLKAIVAFGSAAREAQYEIVQETWHFLWLYFLPFNITRRKLKRPNDIDLLVVYDGEETAQEKQYRVQHTAKFKQVVCGGYSDYLVDGVKDANLHLLHITSGKLEEAVMSKDPMITRIRKDALVIVGTSDYFRKSLGSKNYIYGSELR